jgi:signal transduction histidine kinase
LESIYQLEQNEAKLAKTNAEIARQKTQNQGLILGLTLVLIAAIITYIAYQQKKRAEKQLEEHKKNLEKLVEQKSNELKIEISERKVAEESDKLKSAFLANMSHELRTPMNAIISFSNFLREPKLSYTKRMEYVNYIISSGDSLMHLIDDIIDTAKIESKELRIKKGYTNITRIFSELYHVYSKLKTKNKKEHIELRVNPSNMKFDYITHTDPVRFKQILSNLIENALKYTEEGYIEFGFKENSHELTFYVKDTGIGIAKEKHAYIFQRFSQIEYELDRRFGGTGLGLAISKNLVEMLGGKIWLESELHKGSVFYFTLPIEELIKKPLTNTFDVYNENEEVEKNTYNWQGKVIVVAEDEDLNYRVLESMLSKTRADIVRAANGNEVIEFCKTKNANLILMDIQMPSMDGYSATREIRKFNPVIPIIAQTSFALAGEEEKCIAAGCNDYLSKPLNIRELLEKINKYFYQ